MITDTDMDQQTLHVCPVEIVLASGKSGSTYRPKIQTIVSVVLGALEELDNDFVKALPVYRMLVKVAGVEQFPIEDRFLVAEYLQSVVDGKKTLQMVC
jgi:hypothetical protein